MITASELRQKYLDFFIKVGHVAVPSAPLVPENDPTTLFTGSGMQPMMPYFLGEKHPNGTRIVDSQKCFRSQDIEEVGDNRHTTFFEMLGNWSFGDYFKEEQLAWVFEFLTKDLGLDPKKLYVSAYEGNSKIGVDRDLDTPKIWKKIFKKVGIDAKVIENSEEQGMQDGRIFYYGDGNWWSRSGAPQNMPIGEPGGPDSELFYDFGTKLKLHEKSIWKDQLCHVNCDCGRFLEIGNSVFMQYQKQEDGSFIELPKKNVDFGGGFERILAAIRGNNDVFETDLFTPIIEVLEKISGKKYLEEPESFRVIADHIKAAIMLITDGVFPSNKDQGYFVRRLLRRAIRYGKKMGIEEAFLGKLVPSVVEIYADFYKQVAEKQQSITEILNQEEKKFLRTLEKGLREFEKSTQKTSELTAELAFTLYETYGFPVELSLEEAESQKLSIQQDLENKFQIIKKEHADLSRTASVGKFKGGLQDHSEVTIKYHTATHLIHAALRKVLGREVSQKGSNITGKRLRFDFSHPQAVTKDELKQVEDQVNKWIIEDYPVTKKSMQKQSALDAGALAFFVEKYPEEVTVYTVGSDNDLVSKELCGGPHVESTEKIGPVEIFKEKAVSAGVRRIYARVESKID